MKNELFVLDAHTDFGMRARKTVRLDAPLLAESDGSQVTAQSVARARRRSRALIRAGSEVNVTLCRATGDFFREWGLPGSRFVGPEDLPMEEYR